MLIVLNELVGFRSLCFVTVVLLTPYQEAVFGALWGDAWLCSICFRTECLHKLSGVFLYWGFALIPYSLIFFFFCRLHVSMNAWIPVLLWLIFHYQWLHIVLEVIEVCTFETIFFYCIYVCLIPHIILFQFFCFLIFGCFFFSSWH